MPTSRVSSEPWADLMRWEKEVFDQTSAGVMVLEMYFAMGFSSLGAGAYL